MQVLTLVLAVAASLLIARALARTRLSPLVRRRAPLSLPADRPPPPSGDFKPVEFGPVPGTWPSEREVQPARFRSLPWPSERPQRKTTVRPLPWPSSRWDDEAFGVRARAAAQAAPEPAPSPPRPVARSVPDDATLVAWIEELGLAQTVDRLAHVSGMSWEESARHLASVVKEYM